MKQSYSFGRRPKHDDFDDIHPLKDGEEDYEELDDDGDEDEEVDFDNPTFKRDTIWTDYAEDLDFEE